MWLHGGAFMWGSGSACWFGPQFWMIHDIILVTLNYRWVGVSSLQHHLVHPPPSTQAGATGLPVPGHERGPGQRGHAGPGGGALLGAGGSLLLPEQRTTVPRASNEGLRRFHNYGEGPSLRIYAKSQIAHPS